ncbi:UDP-N-acetylmuramate--L-alanine ligase [Candidatus Kaiserbacteria bacterium]|nr:UDP-N-acetylmuramate--L-alanine ligase [Candidatus Kaiserbacteria bacterium]
MSEKKHIHFIGIGGIGMSGLARLYLHEGYAVSGSDRAPSAITTALQEEGVVFFDTQVKENITDDIDMVVYTEAMPKDHEELVAAKEREIRTISYFEALGEAVNPYHLIAVTGTHGKTTTTAMLIDVFEEAGLDPTAIVGSLRSKTGSNFRAGKSKYAIVEACEYRRDFLTLEPDVLVITNLEHEHVDYYKNLADVQRAFRELAEKVPEDGVIIANTKDPNVKPVLEGLSCTIVDYTQYIDPFLTLSQPGIHNQMNAAAALAGALFVGVSKDEGKRALEQFAGTWRRFEYKGEVNGAKIYDDYGHHPTEVSATIQGARELYPERAVTVVFQPHMYSRLQELFEDFVSALQKADRVLVVPVYDARADGGSEVSSEKLAHEVGEKAYYASSFDEAVSMLQDSLSEKDVVLVMGAGDVTKVTEKLI